MECPSRPSDHWKFAEDYENHEYFDYTYAFWRTVPFNKLEELATRLRSVRCQANREKYAQGHEAVVIELVFEDQEIWVTRLRTPVNILGDAPSADTLARETECEAATLRLVRERTTIPVPTVYAYSGTYDNEVGVPYTIMSAIVGSTPEQAGICFWYPDIRPEDMPLSDCLVESTVEFYLQLSAIRFDCIGSIYFDPSDNSKYIIGPLASNGLGPFNTAWEYYSACADELEEHLLSLPDDTPEDREGRALVLWLYRLGLGLLANSPNNRGPFLLSHNDYSNHNKLIDKQGRVAGMLDWSQAGTVPVEQFAAQSFDYTANLAQEEPPACLSAHRAFSSVLSKLERTTFPPANLPCGKSLSEWHSSPLAYLVGRLFPLMSGSDFCNKEQYAPLLARYVLGVEDASPFKTSVLFKEWYTITMKRVEGMRRNG